MNNLYIFGITSAKGGIELLTKGLVFNLLKDKKINNINIVTSYGKIEFENEYLEKQINIIKICSRKDSNYKKELRLLISKLDPTDIVYLNISSYCNWALFSEVKKTKSKVIIHGHNSHTSNFLKKIFHRIGRYRYRKLGTKIAVSDSCARFMFGKEYDYILENGVDTELYKFNLSNRNKIREELSLSADSFVVGCVGRISKEKNQMQLVKIAKRHLDFSFVFVGDYMSKSYKRRIMKIAPSNCFFIGQRQNVNLYLSAFDALFLPSKHEGFPLAAIEGIANDLPVFYFDNLYKTLPPLLKQDTSSFVYEENDFKKIVIDSHKKRQNKYDLQKNAFDISIFYEKIKKIIYE